MPTKVKRPQPYYDARRSKTTRWVAIVTKTGSQVEHAGFETEWEARKAMGMRGGNKDPRYTGER